MRMVKLFGQPLPMFHTFSVPVGILKGGDRPKINKRAIAEALAEYMIDNGFIVCMDEAKMSKKCDSIEFRFGFWALKKDTDLP